MTGSLPASNVQLYGKQTQLALSYSDAGGRRLADVPEFIRAYAWVKIAAARANVQLGVLDSERGLAIEQAAAETAAGQHNDQFPLRLVQGGGGTSTNMNMNEVLAARATEILSVSTALEVHPNDHVNRSQSTNDSYPTAMALALVGLAAPAFEALERLESALRAKAAERDELLRLGRTCLQDAVPLTVGQTHRGHAHAVQRTAYALRMSVDELRAVPLGATAIGTGIGSPREFAQQALEHLAAISREPLTTAPDFFDSLANLDPYSGLANSCVRAAMVVAKIAGDLRLLSSGPMGGLGEVSLPTVQAGSSIMPGKINPVVPELVMQLSYRIRGAASTVDAGVAAGELELNVMEPVILDALITALGDLRNAADMLARNCIDGLVWNDDAVRRSLRGSLHEYVELAAKDGYDSASETAKVKNRL